MINQHIQNVLKFIPKYWPIGSFIHHNPLLGFEEDTFKVGLEKAKNIFSCKVYMESEYYVDLYNTNKINKDIFNKNLESLLNENGFENRLEEAKKFLLEVSPDWKYHRSVEKISKVSMDKELFDYIENESVYHEYDDLVTSLVKSLTLYEINDALFDTNMHDLVQKDIIEYISRYLDEEQTTLTMHQRELGMFETFKHYENFHYEADCNQYIKEHIELLHLADEDIEHYLLNHLLKLSGWTGFIKYRIANDNYHFQQAHPASIEDYLAIRFYYEDAYIKNIKLKNFHKFDEYYNKNKAYTILKLLKYKHKLNNVDVDKLENSKDYESILKSFINREVTKNTLQVLSSQNEINVFENKSVEYYEFTKFLLNEEGYFWLKVVEDGHIDSYIDKIIAPKVTETIKPLASAVFCIDVRSESMRRFIERSGPYNTYGMAGFLGIPIAFVEFDKGHEQLLCPGVVKANNIIFELPQDDLKEYKKKNISSKTFKKVLSDLKNNPYSPFIMVEAIGWIFGIKLFGKTFFPKKVNNFFKKFKAEVPTTKYTIEKLSSNDIEKYSKKLHFKIIKEIAKDDVKLKLTDAEILDIWNHLIFKDELKVKIPLKLVNKLANEYNITKKDYNYQKSKLEQVGFTLEEQINHIERILKTIGLTKDFPKFVLMVSHAGQSDNNPFESALNCGACGGNSSVPNIRTFIMIINKQDVRDGLKQRNIVIPKDVIFMPAFHNTTTDDIEFLDRHLVKKEDEQEFEKVVNDFKLASQHSRNERIKLLPNTSTHSDMYVKSMDWSETRPEWGLAGNTMAYVGNRELTKDIDLHNKIFLQSYNWENDNEESDLLTKLYDGPLVVGEWINMEHYFSTVDNDRFGAGSKVYHNIVSKVGVFEGNYSDLRIGLASQSVILENKAFHEPIRLIVFLECPLEYGLKALENSKLGKQVILNEWIRLVVIDKRAKKVYLLNNGEMNVIREII